MSLERRLIRGLDNDVVKHKQHYKRFKGKARGKRANALYIALAIGGGVQLHHDQPHMLFATEPEHLQLNLKEL